MRKRLFPRLKTLLTAARVSLYTKRTSAAKPKYSPQPRVRAAHEVGAPSLDDMLFDAKTHMVMQRQKLSAEMARLSDHFSDLRTLIAAVAKPFPVDTVTQQPCAMVTHYDRDLFDGEPDATPPQQDTIYGGAPDFLFGEDMADAGTSNVAA